MIVLVLIIVIVILVLIRKNKSENFQALSTSSSVALIEPNPITVIPGQPVMFRAYKDAGANQTKNYVNKTVQSKCIWFQTGNVVNANYNTNIVSTGNGYDLMFFQLDIPQQDYLHLQRIQILWVVEYIQ